MNALRSSGTGHKEKEANWAVEIHEWHAEIDQRTVEQIFIQETPLDRTAQR